MSSLTLTYFPVAGRGFPIRVALGAAKAAGKISEFNDVRLSFPEFKEKRAAEGGSEMFPLGQMPVLAIDGKTFTQSLALARYAATLAGLRPSDPLQALKVDEIVQTVDEAWNKTPANTPGDAEFANKRKAWAEETIKGKYFPFFERRLSESGGPFFLGSDLTEADLFLHAVYLGISSGMYDHVDKDLFASSAKLSAHAASVAAHPLVVAHGK
jgi:glutathione S-transferase